MKQRALETVRGRKETTPPTAYTLNEVIGMLPQVGSWLWKIPTLKRAKHEKPEALRCQVIYVNTAHLWYTVQFTTAQGRTYREAYKAPEKERKA